MKKVIKLKYKGRLLFRIGVPDDAELKSFELEINEVPDEFAPVFSLK